MVVVVVVALVISVAEPPLASHVITVLYIQPVVIVTLSHMASGRGGQPPFCVVASGEEGPGEPEQQQHLEPTTR